MPVRALVEAGEIFGFAGNSVRVALARLLAQGRVGRDERGRYRQGPAVASALEAIRSWRHLESRTRRWTRGWIAVQNSAGRSRRQRVRDEQALRLFGFRSVSSDLTLRPDNLRGGVDFIRRSLRDVGLCSSAWVARMTDFDSSSERRLCALWDVAELEQGYRTTIQQLSDSRAQLARAPVEQAMVETFRRGGDAIRQLVLDPLLPEEIVSGDSRGLLVASLKEYDAFGRSCWAPFLRRHSVTQRRSPMALRLEYDAERSWKPIQLEESS